MLAFYGKGYTWIPLQPEPGMSLVFGKPIEVTQNDDPSDQEIDELYTKHYDTMREIFDKYKTAAGYSDDETLEIVDEAVHTPRKRKKQQAS